MLGIYPVHVYEATLDHALPLHQVPQAWAMIGGQSNAGAGIKIGILDTGISPHHAAFQDSTLKVPAGFPLSSSAANAQLTTNKIIVARSYEDIYQETSPEDAQDRMGHGTEVAMCAAGVTNSGPYATITGVAPKAFIGGYKIVQGNSGSADEDVLLKALDDAFADGMDVINLSFGSPFQFPPVPDSLEAIVIDQLSRFGVVFVTSAGNSGPGLNTMGDFGSSPEAISVGAMQNNRAFYGSVALGGTSTVLQAFPSSGPVPGPITSTVFDVSTVDPTGLGCSAFPAGSASGQIALIKRGTCTFEVKVNNAQAAGAVAVVLVNNAAGALTASIGAATLPTVTVSNTDGPTLQAAVAAQPSLMATVTFNGIAFAQPSNVIASFSSRGPNWDYSVKPDLLAVGTDVYMATQSLDPTGQLYNANGYVSEAGTSFASPITAGAAAVLRGYRPGLNVDEYRSLIINSATPLIDANGVVGRVQQSGAGVLSLASALQSNIVAYPTSLTYGVGTGTLGGADTGDLNPLTITNVGKISDTFHISTIPFDGAPALQFGPDAGGVITPTSTLDIELAPGQSKTFYAFWTASKLGVGEYQGDINVTSSTSNALVPYWYGVPNGIPAALNVLNSPPATANAGTTQVVYVRITDPVGFAITPTAALGFKSAVTGGGSLTLNPTVFFPNLRELDLKLGPTKGATNTFTFAFGSLAPTTFTITAN